MTTPTFTSRMTVDLIQHVGSDHMTAAAARVSTGKDLAETSEASDAGLIGYLLKHSHGSPLEHSSMTFRIAGPIFTFREWMRHRVGWSYNEVSARYKKLEPIFYVYPDGRPLVQSGSPAHPDLAQGTRLQSEIVAEETKASYRFSWKAYESMLQAGIANEVARTVLPVGIFSEMYVTCNARSMMSFLSLRVDSPDNARETKPQWEIMELAKLMEAEFAVLFPATHAAFVKSGRVSP